jgi:hypothetical protein
MGRDSPLPDHFSSLKMRCLPYLDRGVCKAYASGDSFRFEGLTTRLRFIADRLELSTATMVLHSRGKTRSLNLSRTGQRFPKTPNSHVPQNNYSGEDDLTKKRFINLTSIQKYVIIGSPSKDGNQPAKMVRNGREDRIAITQCRYEERVFERTEAVNRYTGT